MSDFSDLLDEHFAQLGFAGELESVTYKTRRTDASGDRLDTDRPIDLAKVHELDQAEQAFRQTSGQTTTRKISIRKSDLDAIPVTPQRGDTITRADGTAWTVQGWELRSLKSVYEFRCQQGAI